MLLDANDPPNDGGSGPTCASSGPARPGSASPASSSAAGSVVACSRGGVTGVGRVGLLGRPGWGRAEGADSDHVVALGRVHADPLAHRVNGQPAAVTSARLTEHGRRGHQLDLVLDVALGVEGVLGGIRWGGQQHASPQPRSGPAGWPKGPVRAAPRRGSLPPAASGRARLTRTARGLPRPGPLALCTTRNLPRRPVSQVCHDAALSVTSRTDCICRFGIGRRLPYPGCLMGDRRSGRYSSTRRAPRRRYGLSQYTGHSRPAQRRL
jgi:hypothetical protein